MQCDQRSHGERLCCHKVSDNVSPTSVTVPWQGAHDHPSCGANGQYPHRYKPDVLGYRPHRSLQWTIASTCEAQFQRFTVRRGRSVFAPPWRVRDYDYQGLVYCCPGERLRDRRACHARPTLFAPCSSIGRVCKPALRPPSHRSFAPRKWIASILRLTVRALSTLDNRRFCRKGESLC
ncbi:hypothetical protein BAUCODRAFT_30502 [Baudoinia panamericana UAMH 10762]|uniref:Uncharacterized protein n=1 Tax=Baudoinia panamericana (strain UAMH 10762) TaxID=717646 RepID=M2N7J1_BAUPA|nr:uncharacterized protein BAUCODRAFT_30502 [Baudoinia panamericana UAMH 10762]EMD00054.1 hypothetical protein BAUCODRAFT_30502 [Baudoinia panamericana UAMH 10762]